MNFMHLKYALEIEKTGSLNKAAENLYMGQPNLSRAIKELEANLGITIFERSRKGMVATPEGKTFLAYASQIMSQVDEVEALYRQGVVTKQRFSIAVPRASYISEAFVRFSKTVDRSIPSELVYRETNAMWAIKNIVESDYKLGIIRFAGNYDRYFKEMLDERGLLYELIAEFSYVLIMSRNHPLACKENIRYSDLRCYTEIAHAPLYRLSPCPQCRKRNCRRMLIIVSLCLSVAVNLNCLRKIPIHLCGYPPCRKSCSTDTNSFKSPVLTTNASTRTC